MQRPFSHLNFSRQFLLVSFLILVAGMLVIGTWLGRQIESVVVNRNAAKVRTSQRSFLAWAWCAYVSSAVDPRAIEEGVHWDRGDWRLCCGRVGRVQTGAVARKLTRRVLVHCANGFPVPRWSVRLTRAARSSGPGGQKATKASIAVERRFDSAAWGVLPVTPGASAA
jgi:hypothetical protein